MSRLRLLLTTAARQYASLTLNRCPVSTSVLKQNFHASSCMKFDMDDLMDKTEQRTKTNETEQPKKKPYVASSIDEDYRPGGDYIPSAKTRSHLVDGVRFDKLPRVYIKTTYNNTLITAYDYARRRTLCIKTGGAVGFKNSKKKSTVCGQTVGLAVGMDLVKKGIKNVVVIVSGQGSGRLPAIKGVQLSGINIIAITDKTYPAVTTRPKGARSL